MSMMREMPARLHARDGLREAGTRLRNEPCTIAYLGASVTAQREGYSSRLHELLCRLWKQPHRMIWAGTGALGSLSGVFLMDELVVKHRPQLCFVEYATGDFCGRTPPEELGPAIEGIAQKLRDIGCEPCFLYLYRSDIGFDGLNQVLAVYEAVAKHHHVPSIDLARPIHAQVA